MIHQLNMAITTNGSNHKGIWIQSKHLMQIPLENGPTLVPKINTQPAKLQPSLIMPKHSGYSWKSNLLIEGEGRAGQELSLKQGKSDSDKRILVETCQTVLGLTLH